MMRSLSRETRSASSVTVLGILMVLAGAYEVYFGNTYISVERGWSAFISGTVLVTGGLVTISLGLAIRAIADLSTALRHRGGSPQGEIAPAYTSRDVVVAAPVTQQLSPRVEPSSGALAAALTPQAVPDLLSTDEGPSPTPGFEHGKDLALGDHDAPSEPAHPATLHGEPVHTSEVFHDRDRETYADIGSAHPIVEPAMDDRLDRSSADLGRDIRRLEEHGTSLPEEPDPLALADIEHQVPEDHEPTGPASEPHAVPNHDLDEADLNDEAPPTAPSSPVIGRYDAEGTSYVMYADGSIEAQSEAGVYRFASMAELKAFIEG